MKELLSKLNEKLNPENIKTRIQQGKKLSYIEGYYAEGQANRIFDYKWSKELLNCEKLFERQYTKEDGKEMIEVAYKATVRVHFQDLGVYRDGTGAGNGQSSNLFGAYELAMKEAETDAMKRALKSMGNQFGIELYDKDYSKEDYDRSLKLQIEIVEAKEELKKCKTLEEVRAYYKSYNGGYRKEIEKLIADRKKELL